MHLEPDVLLATHQVSPIPAMTVHLGRAAVWALRSISLKAVSANLDTSLGTTFAPEDQLRIFPSTRGLLPESFQQRLVSGSAEHLRAPQLYEGGNCESHDVHV